ncbi:hypothetical protein DFP72DRAFT_1169373 [Ephemerocybe angulata]|uniref:SNF5-domain-containing protein n=1 Tax=Ephemerocybe angulata TaxID=980116 RepID=A0A8H6HZP7_9AGAR|nr:hypothetical protein DFP72DRAFT_1169373 [Tulosesus angulatus]
MGDRRGTPSGSNTNFPVGGSTTTFDINSNMTDSQFRHTWNQISSAASTIAAAPSTYAAPAPQLPQNKGATPPSQSYPYMKNVQTWSSTSTPAPKNAAGMSSSSRPSRARSTRAGAGTSTPNPGTPIQTQPPSSATSYVQPIYSQPPVPMQPSHQYPQAAYHPQQQLQQQQAAPPPATAYALPPPAISNPPKAPLPNEAAGARVLVLLAAEDGHLAARAADLREQHGGAARRGPGHALVAAAARSSTTADPGSGDDLPDAGELDSGDSDFGGGPRQSGGGRQAAGQQGRGRRDGGCRSRADQVEQSYLGMVPPARFVKPRLMLPTPHEYPSADVMFVQAQKRTSLVPIRVEFETETLRVRDCFVWNVNETLIKPESFARVFCNDLDLPLNPWAETVAAQIRAQIEEYQDVAAMELGMDGAVNTEMGSEEVPECRVILSIDVQIANHHLMDQIEWDLLSPLTPEEFSRKLCSELGLTGEAIPLIAHAVHEELVKHKKDVIEWGVLGTAPADNVEATPAPGADGATPGPEKPRDRSGYSLLKDKTGLGLGWGRAPRDGRGPKTLRGVWRDWVDAEEFATSFEVMTAEEVDRREVERERASRRLRRETSKFQSNVTGRMRNLRYR